MLFEFFLIKNVCKERTFEKKKIKDPEESKTSRAKMCMGTLEFGRGLGSQNSWGRQEAMDAGPRAGCEGLCAWLARKDSDLQCNHFDQK